MLVSIKSVFRHALQSPQFLLLLLPLYIYFLARQYALANFYRDPTSFYFDPSRAYSHMYTAVRSAEADAFVVASATRPFHRTVSTPPFLCIGMLTVARPGGYVYFRTSIGSLLEGLTQEERNGIYLMPFVTHTDPNKHPVYLEPWLHNVVDRILTYNESGHLTEEQFAHVKDLEAERERTGQPDREKHIFDYGLLMKQCSDVNATYVAMMEDDILALDGWYHRTRAGLKEVERTERSRGNKDFFYLRLFYTEQLLGWNPRDWNALYCGALFFAILTPSAIFAALRKTSFVRMHGYVLFGLINISIFLFLLFFFTFGAVSMLPMSHGVHEMPNYGCCAQGIVYPTTKVDVLTKWYEENHVGFVDTLAEKLADEKPEVTGARWAITPCVLQHIGGKSSKGDNWGGDKPGKMTEAEKLWNFEFELNDAEELRKEHELDAWIEAHSM